MSNDAIAIIVLTNHSRIRLMGDLSDKELRTKLMAYGCVVGPITDTTRRVYVAKLHSLQGKGTAISSRATAASHVAGGVARAPSRVPKLIRKKDWEQDYKKPVTVEGTLTVLQSTLPCQSSPPSSLPPSADLPTSSQPNPPARPACHTGPSRAEGTANLHTPTLPLAAPLTGTSRKCSPSPLPPARSGIAIFL